MINGIRFECTISIIIFITYTTLITLYAILYVGPELLPLATYVRFNRAFFFFFYVLYIFPFQSFDNDRVRRDDRCCIHEKLYGDSDHHYIICRYNVYVQRRQDDKSSDILTDCSLFYIGNIIND